MNIPLTFAGSLAVLGAAVHGGGGELIVMRKLPVEVLPATPFGGPRTTKAMIHVTWHLTTVAFLTVGVTLLLSGAILSGEAAQAIGLVGAGASTAFAALIVGMGAADTKSPRSLLRHPGPLVLTAVATLAWSGAL